MDYGLKIDITKSKEYVRMSILILEEILEKVMDNDECRVAVGELLKEKNIEIATLLQKEKELREKNNIRCVSPCPCGCEDLS